MTIDPRFTTLIDSPIASVTKLHGDASYRVYYRLATQDGRTYIVMQLPEGKASISEEITNFSGKLNELPFQNVQRFLKASDIPVPDIITYNPELRLMLLEDCGDDLLFTKVDGADDATRLQWYGKAVELLCTIQKNCNGARARDCVALQRAFDATLLNWEFDHFASFGIEARQNKKLSEKVRSEFERITRKFSDHIMEVPYGFTHRDYQSRNLLIHNNALVVIDFQDALRGPFVYDLVALTRDSYVQLSDTLIDTLIAQFAKARELPVSVVRNAYDLVTIQRKLKDTGRFVYIDQVKKNSNYLKFIPTSLAYVKNALGRVSGGQELYDLLKPWVPEWQS